MGVERGARKPRPGPSDLDKMHGFVTWAKTQPEFESEEQEELLRCIASVCSQVGTWKAKHEQAEAEVRRLRAANAVLREGLDVAAYSARHIITTAVEDKWTSPGLEFGCSVIERDARDAIAKAAEIEGNK